MRWPGLVPWLLRLANTIAAPTRTNGNTCFPDANQEPLYRLPQADTLGAPAAKNSILDDHQSLALQLNKLSSGLAMIITKQPTEPLAACDTTVDRPAFVAGFSYLVAKTLVIPFTVVCSKYSRTALRSILSPKKIMRERHSDLMHK